jgi:hypothetical protein
MMSDKFIEFHQRFEAFDVGDASWCHAEQAYALINRGIAQPVTDPRRCMIEADFIRWQLANLRERLRGLERR